MPLMPKRVKYRKNQRGKVRGEASRGNHVAFGEFGLQALEGGWLSAESIEAGRGTATGFVRGEVFRNTVASLKQWPVAGVYILAVCKGMRGPSAGRNSLPTTSTRTSASLTMYAISAGARRQFTATLIALSLPPPNRTSKYSGPFLSMNPTCCWTPTLSAASARATWLERASIAA